MSRSQFADVERLMIKARTALILNPAFLFFGTLALRLKMIPDEATETASCDGIEIRYNPDFVRKLNHDQRVGLVAHETMHAAAGHPFRLGGREHERFNEAADYVINKILTDAGITLPDGALLDPQYDGMSAEEVYSKLPPKPKQSGGGPGKGNVGGCGVFNAPKDPKDPQQQPLPKDQQQALARDWQIATMQAASVAKRVDPGTVPGSAEEMIDAMRNNRVDRYEALKRFIVERSDDDYDWTRPNKRFIAQNIYLPSIYSERLGPIVFAIDTSISMNSNVLRQALADLNAIMDEFKPESVHVIECDTAVGWEGDFTPDDFPITNKTMTGRGGTAFAPVFERVAERQLEPACLIYFTDLDCSNFGPEPSYPVLWAATDPGGAPFGEVIRVDLD